MFYTDIKDYSECKFMKFSIYCRASCPELQPSWTCLQFQTSSEFRGKTHLFELFTLVRFICKNTKFLIVR